MHDALEQFVVGFQSFFPGAACKVSEVVGDAAIAVIPIGKD
jgi:hypothetical protein